MDPYSFAAAFLLSREPVTQLKLTESQVAVTHASAEPGQETVPAPKEPTPQPEPVHPRGPIAPPETGPDFPEDEPKPEPKEAEPEKPDPTTTKNARGPERIITPVWLCPSPPRTGPTSWRLVDRFGVTWTHSDKTYLEQFVATRNTTVLVTPRTFYAGSCSNGRCAR